MPAGYSLIKRENGMSSELKNALSLVRGKKYSKAVFALESIRSKKNLPPVLVDSIDFNIIYCNKKIHGKLAQGYEEVKIGVICPADNKKGLYRDAETILWAFFGDTEFSASALLVPGNLYKYDYQSKLHDSHEVRKLSKDEKIIWWIDQPKYNKKINKK